MGVASGGPQPAARRRHGTAEPRGDRAVPVPVGGGQQGHADGLGVVAATGHAPSGQQHVGALAAATRHPLGTQLTPAASPGADLSAARVPVAVHAARAPGVRAGQRAFGQRALRRLFVAHDDHDWLLLAWPQALPQPRGGRQGESVWVSVPVLATATQAESITALFAASATTLHRSRSVTPTSRTANGARRPVDRHTRRRSTGGGIGKSCPGGPMTCSLRFVTSSRRPYANMCARARERPSLLATAVSKLIPILQSRFPGACLR